MEFITMEESESNNTLIDYLAEYFGSEWSIYKRGEHINIRILLVFVFFDIIGKRNIIVPKYNFDSFYNEFGSEEIVFDVEFNDNPYLPNINLDMDKDTMCKNYLEYFGQNNFLDLKTQPIYQKIIPKIIDLALGTDESIKKMMIQSKNPEISDKQVDQSIKTKYQNSNIDKLIDLTNRFYLINQFVETNGNFGLIFSTGVKLIEGIDVSYYSGGCPTVQTQIRELVVKKIIGHQKSIRKTNKRVFCGTTFDLKKKKVGKKNNLTNKPISKKIIEDDFMKSASNICGYFGSKTLTLDSFDSCEDDADDAPHQTNVLPDNSDNSSTEFIDFLKRRLEELIEENNKISNEENPKKRIKTD